MKHLLFCAAIFSSTAGARPVLIHPLGDSITNGFDNEGYRAALYELLKGRGLDFHFVGSLATGPASLPERAHDGHNGAVVETLAQNIDGWLARFRPDVVLLMIGANDIEVGATSEAVVARIRTLIERIARAAPRTRVLVSEITVIREPRFDREAVAVNAKLPSLASENVTFVPMHDAIGVDDLRDLDHPRPAGNRKIAERWLKYLEPVVRQIATPAP